jgi:uncharacterized protein DUF5681
MASDPPHKEPPHNQEPDDENVGYKNPPKKHRWRKGESGNKMGRPKASSNFLTALRRQFGAPVLMREGNKSKTVSKFEAVTASHIAHASNGKTASVGALRTLFELASRLSAGADTANSDETQAIKIEIHFAHTKPPRAGQIVKTDGEGNAVTNKESEWDTTKLLPMRR